MLQLLLLHLSTRGHSANSLMATRLKCDKTKWVINNLLQQQNKFISEPRTNKNVRKIWLCFSHLKEKYFLMYQIFKSYVGQALTASHILILFHFIQMKQPQVDKVKLILTWGYFFNITPHFHLLFPFDFVARFSNFSRPISSPPHETLLTKPSSVTFWEIYNQSCDRRSLKLVASEEQSCC